MDLAGRVAFVTGGSGDVGAAVSQALASAGADVALSYVGNTDGATSTVDAIQALGRRAMAVQVDQRDPAAIDAATRQVVERFGRARHPREQRGLEHRHSVQGPRRAHPRRMGPGAGDQSARSVLVGSSTRASPARAPVRSHREHRLRRRTVSHEQQHRVLGEQGGVDSPHALSRSRPRARGDGQLRGTRVDRRDPHGEAAAGRSGGCACERRSCWDGRRASRTSQSRW